MMLYSVVKVVALFQVGLMTRNQTERTRQADGGW